MYQVSNMGNVRSVTRKITGGGAIATRIFRGKIIKQRPNPKGYYGFALSKNGIVRQYRTHRIVARVFIPNPENLPEINHKDEIKANNRADNLEWCDHLYNIRYGTGMDRKSTSQTGKPNTKNRGEGCGTSKLKSPQVVSIFHDKRKYKEIADDYGISFATISGIKNRTKWRHLLKAI